MAENQKDAPAGAEKEAAAPSAAPSGFKAFLPLIITLVLMPALAYGMTMFVLLPKLQKGLGITAPAEQAGDKDGNSKKDGETKTRENVAMNKLLVNVAGTMGARYLLVNLEVVGTGTDFKEKMKEHDAQMRDAAMGILRTKTLADLEKPGAPNLIRSELISGFNTILGDSLVQEIYLTEFAIQ